MHSRAIARASEPFPSGIKPHAADLRMFSPPPQFMQLRAIIRVINPYDRSLCPCTIVFLKFLSPKKCTFSDAVANLVPFAFSSKQDKGDWCALMVFEVFSSVVSFLY